MGTAKFATPPVLKAVRARLLGTTRLAGRPVYAEAIVKGAPTTGEYVTIGPFTEVPRDTMGDCNGADLTAAIKVVSYSHDLAPGYALCEHIIQQLHRQALTVDGYATAWALFEVGPDVYSELVAGVPVTHFPLIFRIHVSEAV